jgi:hypothetical protein
MLYGMCINGVEAWKFQNAHDLLGNQISPNSEIFIFWRSFWIQNGRHSKPKWSQCGAAYLTPCKYPLPKCPPLSWKPQKEKHEKFKELGIG